MNGAAIVVETLIAHGVSDVFGYPGGQVLNLYDELYNYRDRIRHRLVCHEQGAAHAADAYARATGEVGVVIATSGPGATNLVTGIATAYLDSSPVVAITGNVPTTLMGRDSFQEVDITGITMPITKHNFLVKDIAQLEETLQEAFLIAKSGRPGPVLVDIPKDVQIAETTFKGGAPLERETPAAKPADQAHLEAAAALINASERPFIYAGGGVVLSDAGEFLKDFAEHLDAPVGLSMMGLTGLDSKHPLYLGMTGMHGIPESSKMTAEADLIIGVGVRFSDRATGDTKRYRENTKILHLDIDDSEIDKNIGSTVSVLGDLGEYLPRLIAMIEQKDRSFWKGRAEKVREEVRQATRGYQSNGDELFTPRNIIGAVRERASDDTVVCTDVGQHQMWVAQHYGFSKPRTFLTSGGLGTMGFGMGAAVGASIAKNNAHTLLFSGDGSFHMNMNEFATAVRYDLPVTVIVMNNSVLGMVRQWQNLFYGERYSQTTLERPTDYVKLAEALGGTGYNADNLDELGAALDAAFAGKGQTIINCRIDQDNMVFPIIPPGGSFDDMLLEKN